MSKLPPRKPVSCRYGAIIDSSGQQVHLFIDTIIHRFISTFEIGHTLRHVASKLRGQSKQIAQATMETDNMHANGQV